MKYSDTKEPKKANLDLLVSKHFMNHQVYLADSGNRISTIMILESQPIWLLSMVEPGLWNRSFV